MRIYNGKNSQLELPLGNGRKLTIGAQSISGDFLPSTNFLNLLVKTFHYDEIALIVSGITELNLCSSVSSANGFVVHTVAEAVERFSKPIEDPKNPAVLDAENKLEGEEPKKKAKKPTKKEEENSEESESPSKP